MSIESLESMMREAAKKAQTVHAVDIDNIEYEGKAFGFTFGHDEEDGYATFCIRDPRFNICLGSNELKSLEVIA